MKCRHLSWANAWSPSIMLAWMPSDDHHAYEVAIMCVQTKLYKHVSKYWPFQFNGSLWHILVTFVFIVNTLSISSYFSLISLLFSSSNSLLHFKTCVWLQPSHYPKELSSEILMLAKLFENIEITCKGKVCKRKNFVRKLLKPRDFSSLKTFIKHDFIYLC